jgi:hypothetical protein
VTTPAVAEADQRKRNQLLMRKRLIKIDEECLPGAP